jgi:hypothetical protein
VATIEVKSAQRGIPSEWVQVDGITDAEVKKARANLDRLITTEEQVSTAVAMAFVMVVEMCPTTNPSDLWQHVIYRHSIESGWSDNRWKRVSGFALERAFVAIYTPRLESHGLRLRLLAASEANQFLAGLGADVRATKVDLFLEVRNTACVGSSVRRCRVATFRPTSVFPEPGTPVTNTMAFSRLARARSITSSTLRDVTRRFRAPASLREIASTECLE